MEIITCDNLQKAQNYLIKVLTSLSTKHDVLWLLSGGSNIALACKIAESLPELTTDRITVGLVDERYGEIGHNNSNWQQLVERGFPFDLFQTMPILTANSSVLKCSRQFNKGLSDWIKVGSPIVTLLGIGIDGHTAGILPKSKVFKSNDLAIDYNASVFKRITIAPSFFKHINHAVVCASGKSKASQINKLEEQISFEDQPAQLIKLCHKSTVFFIC